MAVSVVFLLMLAGCFFRADSLGMDQVMSSLSEDGTYLNLENAGLTGTIPTDLGTLSNLTVVILRGNRLTGSIPPELGNLRNLLLIALGNNSLSGSIPAALGKLAKLEVLDLSFNRLVNSIPPELGNLGSLLDLNLNNNSLSGSVPVELGRLTNLTTLLLGYNNFTSFPASLGNLSRLNYFELSRNPPLSGNIPPELGLLTNLTTGLFLGHCNLSGTIPRELGNLTKLTNLGLNDNHLSGPIPLEFGNLAGLEKLGLNSNNLSGPIPPQLGALANLTYLNLSVNGFSGPIPPQLGNLSRFETFNLSFNNLSGPISPQLSQFSTTILPGNPGLCNGSQCIATIPPAKTPSLPASIVPSTVPAQSPPIAPAPPPFSAPQPPPPPASKASSPVAAIAGSIAGAVIVAAILLTALLCWLRKRKRNAIPATAVGFAGGSSESTLPQASIPTGGIPRSPLYKFERSPMSDPRQAGPEFSPAAKAHVDFKFRQLKAATNNFAEGNVIGRGSFGTVYRATLADGSVVAVKRLERRVGRQMDEEKSWKAEVDMLSKVRHKNLVPLLGVCVNGGERLLVLEFFPMGSLSKWLQDGESVLTWTERMGIVRGITRGLTYLHNDLRPPIVHRDIKAANILLTADGDTLEACIADFGLARLAQDISGSASTMVKGTVQYMAPEYLHGGPRYLTPKCDVYSYGLLLLEIVSGRSVVMHLQDGTVQPLSETARELVRRGDELDLVDGRLGTAYDAVEALSCIRLAVACLDNRARMRPAMEQINVDLTIGTVRRAVEDSEGYEGDLGPVDSSMMGLEDGFSSSSGYGYGSGSSWFPSKEHTILVSSRFVEPR